MKLIQNHMKLFEYMKVDGEDLFIGGVKAVDIAKDFNTPVYVYDEDDIRQKCRKFKDNFKSDKFQTEVTYASKAFSCIEMARLVAEEDLSLDVVSEGELYTALCADFPMSRVYFHGNNKLDRELKMAIELGVGTIIIDSISEAKRLAAILDETGTYMRVILRVNPGIDAHTHKYIQTAKNDSKFGEATYSKTTYETIKYLKNCKNMKFRGFHCHIGSQIFEEESFLKAAEVMLDYMAKVKEEVGISTDILNLGGGFGVYYTEGDRPFDLKDFLTTLVTRLEEGARSRGVRLSKVIIEPGRSLVCNSGTTLYTVGDTKTLDTGLNYLFIDGGMTDNPRPSLYEAKYEVALANKMARTANTDYDIGGKCCESGDVLVRGAKLPGVEPGDVLAMFSTGAYTFSMSSNYNRLPRPAVVFVKDDKAREVVRRQSLEDLIRNDIGGR